MTKIQHLHLYLDKEQTNLENLKSTNANRQDIMRAEHTIRTLQEQLRLLCVEVNKQFTIVECTEWTLLVPCNQQSFEGRMNIYTSIGEKAMVKFMNLNWIGLNMSLNWYFIFKILYF